MAVGVTLRDQVPRLVVLVLRPLLSASTTAVSRPKACTRTVSRARLIRFRNHPAERIVPAAPARCVGEIVSVCRPACRRRIA